MNETFYRSNHLPREQLHSLIKRSDQPALRRFTAMFGLVAVAHVWVVLAWGGAWWNIAFSQLLFAVTVCSTFACLHETAHGTAFKSKTWNQTAAFLSGMLHIYPSSLFRELHFTHHRYTHVPGKDPEISLGNRPAPSVIANLPMYLSWLTGLPLLLFKVGMLVNGALAMPEFVRSNLYPFVRPAMRGKIALESCVVLLFHLSIVMLALLVDARFWAIMVGQLAGHCLLAAYLVAEHNGLPHEGDILDKTRSMENQPVGQASDVEHALSCRTPCVSGSTFSRVTAPAPKNRRRTETSHVRIRETTCESLEIGTMICPTESNERP